ncbi:flagellar hook-associated protein FlgK [Teredinibacter sp. KSP-S5-2]|uniref:flagellar hook-associated protein FlgK n=1 Tax=Teredinibacter sp. KSP-S5-2 TaxID=3034506 RepID=UPI002934B5C2|nr:flagellar hook-associated protein FlgK [Teredinibacter sp. KSP-S5-2]WNO07964.1 flagellar hook-associated protein FlgK [Teredinibacter sp. KSP-S5-2]
MASDLLGISVSGLRVAQASLSTTGHNIANAGVDGYSRQRVLVETNPANFQGGGYIGNGANVASVDRVVNNFVIEQLRTDTTLFNDLKVFNENISQLDTLLADESSGLSSGLEKFFAAVQNAADDPTSIPARQLIISESENLADRFNTIYERFNTINEGVSEAIDTGVAKINALTSNIAELNRKITDAYGRGDGASPNDLLDQRDEAIRQLSELVSIQTYDQGFGQINIIVGQGQNLVVGTNARELAVIASPEDAKKQDIVFVNESGGQIITNLISGGEIGGLIRFRDTVMDQAYNEFGRIAVVMADTFNEVHSQGVNLQNDFGGLFFYDVNDPTIAANRIIGNSNNTADSGRYMRLNIDDPTQITASEYDMEVGTGGRFEITRLSDNKVVSSGLLTGVYPFSIEFDGLELVIDGGAYQAGDSFRLQPTKSGARDFSSELLNPESIAFGSPVLTDTSLANLGTGSITPGQVLSLVDQNGDPLPLFAQSGEMNPPLIIQFTSPTTYDILDNSDPGNPVQLDPPIRNQRYVPGIDNPLFSTDPGETRISTGGGLIGLIEGNSAVTQASIQIAAAVPPSFVTTDFSASGNQFSFDVVASNTPNGANDGTFTVTVDGGAITDETALLAEINSQLIGSDVVAYIADNGSLAFRSNTPGYGDITLNNYNGDPDGGLDIAPAGQANALLGFDIEGATFTTVGDVNGISGDGEMNNGYPAEVIHITLPPASPGADPITQTIITSADASMRETASILSNIPGVSANAYNYIELQNFNITDSTPLQFTLNGEDLLEYTADPMGNGAILYDGVPNPVTELEDFNDYVVSRINENENLSAAGIYAVAGRDAITGESEIRIYSSEGDDFNFSFFGASGESVDISDGENAHLSLSGAGNGVASSIVVGGRMDVTMADGISLATLPPQSMLFGDTTAADFAQSSYLGIQASISGIPQTGDTFTIDFNVDAASDNRNALNLAGLETAHTIGGGISSYSEGYASLVERIGINTASSKINTDAAKQVLEQSTEMRNSISAVNLDEEAADLIKFEQLFAANSQVISVARDLFERLIGAF